MAIAIDFGTSNTVISRWNAATQQAETVTLPGLSLVGGMNPPLIPSLVYVEDGSTDRILLGQMVRDRGLDLQGDNRFFRGLQTADWGRYSRLFARTRWCSMTFERVGIVISHQGNRAVATVPARGRRIACINRPCR